MEINFNILLKPTFIYNNRKFYTSFLKYITEYIIKKKEIHNLKFPTPFKMFANSSQYQQKSKIIQPQSQFYVKQRKPKKENYLAKSSSMASILGNLNENISPNTHFVDSLERFRKDHAAYDKQQRQRQRQHKLKILEQRKNLAFERESRIKRNQYYNYLRNQEKLNHSRLLYAMGIKRNGYSNGLPLDPITLKYHNNPFGNMVRCLDEEKLIKQKVRAQHLQNASTCGYNLVNGENLVRVENYIPQNTYERFSNKLCQFYQTKKLDPNVDLQLNPKTLLPRNIGQIQKLCSSPIKKYRFEDQNSFDTSYNTHYNQKPFEETYQSRYEAQVYNQYLATPQTYNTKP